MDKVGDGKANIKLNTPPFPCGLTLIYMCIRGKIRFCFFDKQCFTMVMMAEISIYDLQIICKVLFRPNV